MFRTLGSRRVAAAVVASGLSLAAAACGSDDAASGTTAAATTAFVQTTTPGATSAAPTSEVSTITAPVEGATRTVATHYGDVEIPAEPQRVVAVSYDTPWQLMAVGVTPVGVQDYGRWISSFTPAQQAFVDGVATIGTYGELNIEAIAAVQPDLIVGDAYEIDEAVYEQLSAIAPTAIFFGDSRGDWKTLSADIADAAGAGDAVADAVATYDAELARIKDTYADALALPWAHVSLGDTEAEFSVQYPSGVIGAMIFTELGATLAPSLPDAAPESGYESYSFEQMGNLLADAQVVAYPLNADGSEIPLVAAVIESPFFAPPAQAAGQVFGLAVSVTDYATATAYLQEIETTILQHVG